MLSLDHARQILGAAGEKLSDSELLELLAQLRGLAEVVCSVYLKQRDCRIGQGKAN
jgi:hypothetical protein